MSNTTVPTHTSHIKQLHLLLLIGSIFFINGVLMKTLSPLVYDLNGLSFTFHQTDLTSLISLFYITMLIGGIASRVYECNNNILIGYVLTVVGLFVTLQSDIYLIGLTTYIVGSGLIIPNVYMHVSHQHAINSPTRALYMFGIFTMSSIGLAMGLLSGNALIQLSAVSELIILGSIAVVGLLLFLLVNYYTETHTFTRTPLVTLTQQLEYVAMINVLIFGGIGLFSYILSFPWLSNWLLVGATLTAFIFVISLTAKSHPEQRVRNMIILCLFFLGACYWITNSVLTYCLSTYLPLKKLFQVNYLDMPSLITMSITLETIGLSIVLIALILIMYCFNQLKRRPISFISLIGIALITMFIVVVLFNLFAHMPTILTASQERLNAMALLGTMAITKALIIPCIIVLIGQLIPRRQEGLFISFFQTTLGLSMIIGQQFLDSVNWSIELTYSHPVYSYYQLGLVILILAVAACVLFLGLLKPIWDTAKTLR